jgi:hypothetical protein
MRRINRANEGPLAEEDQEEFPREYCWRLEVGTQMRCQPKRRELAQEEQKKGRHNKATKL